METRESQSGRIFARLFDINMGSLRASSLSVRRDALRVGLFHFWVREEEHVTPSFTPQTIQNDGIGVVNAAFGMPSSIVKHS